jgi:hypothetical protein
MERMRDEPGKSRRGIMPRARQVRENAGIEADGILFGMTRSR